MATLVTRSGKGSPLTHTEVDANFTNLNTDKLELSGGTLTGDITLSGDPSASLHAATKQYVDTIAAAGLHYHTPVRVETPSALSASYDNGTNGVGATLTNSGALSSITIDGTSLNLNDRVLVYNQAISSHNGIYKVTTVGDGSTAWVLTRATDADSYGVSDPDALGQGDAFFVSDGATGAGELYVMNTEGAISFGTTDITFAQVASTAVYTAGSGISLNGTTIVNSSPDQTVSITGSGIASVSGTYPNFDVSVTALQSADVGVTVQAYDGNLSSFVSTFTLPTSDGTADQILKTDGSGGLSFADAGAAGGSVELTAAESLSAGDLVSVNSSGNAAVVVGGSGSLVESLVSYTTGTNGTSTSRSFAHWSEASQKLGFYYKHGTAFYFGYASVNQTTGAISSTGSVTIQSAGAYSPQGTGVYDATRNRHVHFVERYNGSSYEYFHGSVSPTGSSSSLQTWSTGSTWGIGTSRMCLVYHPSIGKCLIVRAESGGVYVSIVTVDGSGNVSLGTETQISTATYLSTPHAVYDPDNDIVSVFTLQSGQSKVYWQGVTVSGTTITATSLVSLSIGFTPSGGSLKVAYDTREKCYAVAGRVSTETSIVAIECDGSTITTRGSALSGQGGGYGTLNLEYIKNTGKFGAFHQNGSTAYVRSYQITASGIARVSASDDLDYNFSVVDLPKDGTAAVTDDLIMFPTETSTNVVKIFAGASAYNNENYGSFVGFSDDAYASGSTATINTVGSVNTSQTGLTAGAKYYVQSDGTLSTSADTVEVSAGIALSSTSILVK